MARAMKPGEHRVRLVGGSHGGEIFITSYPTIKLPSLKNVDFPPPIGPANHIGDAEFETYKVEKFNFGTGHCHYYGILESMRAVDAFNVMWNAYTDARQQEYSNE